MAKRLNKKRGNSKKDIIIKCITIIAIIVVIAIVYNFISNLQTINFSVKEHSFYQYVMGNKVEYKGTLKIEKKNDITELTAEQGTIYLTSIPIYYNDERNKAILPEDMAIAFPMNNGALYKVNALSTIYIDYGSVYVQKGELNKELYDAFLYDGNDLYFFIETTTVTVDDIEYKLPPLSYVNATYKGYVEIYNYDTDEYTYIDQASEDVIAKTSKYTINLSIDSMQYEGNDQLLLKRIKNLISLKNEQN